MSSEINPLDRFYHAPSHHFYEATVHTYTLFLLAFAVMLAFNVLMAALLLFPAPWPYKLVGVVNVIAAGQAAWFMRDVGRQRHEYIQRRDHYRALAPK